MRSCVPAYMGVLPYLLAGTCTDSLTDHHSVQDSDDVHILICRRAVQVQQRGDLGTAQRKLCTAQVFYIRSDTDHQLEHLHLGNDI